MIKTAFIFLLLVITAPAFAQYNTKIYNLYLDFNEAEFKDQQAKAMLKADSILNSPEKLPAKSQVHFYRSLAKMYEEQHQPEKSILYNEKVIAAVPDFYISHRALGYLYLLPANGLVEKINQSKTDRAAYEKYQSQYFSMIKKALPHLEKAEACDHDDETLKLIKSLYQKLNDKAGLASLDNRLKSLKTNCIDLLTD
jgi:CHAT domain-containing protein